MTKALSDAEAKRKQLDDIDRELANVERVISNANVSLLDIDNTVIQDPVVLMATLNTVKVNNILLLH